MNNELWKWRRVESGESKNRLPPLPTTPWKSRRRREIPHSHSSDDGLQDGESENKNWKLLGRGKLEIQKRDSHFPTAPAACGSKEETIYRTKNRDRLRRPKRDTSIEVTPGTFLTRLDNPDSAD